MSIKKSLFLATLLFQISIPVALAADPTYPIISESICEKSATEGGFGGDCQYIAIDFSSLGLGESDGCTGGKVFKGYCGETGGDWSDLDYSCCTPAGSTVSQPLVGEAMYRDSTCTLPKASGGSYGGTCKSSCDSATEKYAGVCAEADTPCCVSNDTPTAAETGSLSTSSLSSVGNVNVSTDYIPLENVPFIKDASSFQAYLEGIYILGMVLVVIGAVFMLVIGGFQYLTSAGNTSALSAAKHTIEGALFGLALALVAYLILYVINPDLVKLNITRFQPLALQPDASSGSGGSGGTGGAGATGSTRPCAGGIVSIPSGLGKRLTGSSANQICKDIADRLIQLKQRSGLDIYVTSSIRTGGSQSNCHKSGNADSGNCADIGLSTSLPLHDPRWDALCAAVGSTPGLQLVNEASNRPACSQVAPFRQYTYSSGAHFHVKFIGP